MRPKAGQRTQTSRGPDKAGYEVGQRQDVGLLRPIIGQSNSLTFGKHIGLCSRVCAPQSPGGRGPVSSRPPPARSRALLQLQSTSAHSALTSPLRLPRRRPELHSSSAGGAQGRSGFAEPPLPADPRHGLRHSLTRGRSPKRPPRLAPRARQSAVTSWFSPPDAA